MSKYLNDTPRVYLIGAGPGDPGMLTLRGAQCLARADLVLYDYLVNPEILSHARQDAELICLGRHGRDRIWTQDEINEKMIEASRAALTVARLKGGDPAVFARGAEEAEALRDAGIRFEIIPGITVALAAGSCAGIPITHRDLASAVALVTGQRQQDHAATKMEFESLASFPGTLVFYMGVTTASEWTRGLIEAGKSIETPAAIIRRCSLPDQLTIHCTLGEVAEHLKQHQLRPPVITIVGEVATLAPTLTWFQDRPLFGQAVLVTRPADQASSLHVMLAELGAEVLVQPAIEIGPPDDWRAVDEAIDRLGQYDWLVFSSSNGVRFLLDRILASGRDMRALGGVRIAAIGPGTNAELQRYRLRADLQPDEYRAESLASALASEAAGRKCLLVRASRGREVLAEQLAEGGADIEQVVVYNSTDVERANDEIAARLASGEINWITVTSSAIARSLAAMFGSDLKNSQLVSISPITTETLGELGLAPAAEATEYTMAGVVDAMVEAV